MSGAQAKTLGLIARRRRILFRSWHRGMREMDLILGRFAALSFRDEHRHLPSSPARWTRRHDLLSATFAFAAALLSLLHRRRDLCRDKWLAYAE